MTKNFLLGEVRVTPLVECYASERNIDLDALLARHASGDWGDVDEHDRLENDRAVDAGLRIFSSYSDWRWREKIWIITEADRSATTILLPEEY